jgi:hypothetical protein
MFKYIFYLFVPLAIAFSFILMCSFVQRVVYTVNINNYVTEVAVIKNIKYDYSDGATPQALITYSINGKLYNTISYLHPFADAHNIPWIEERLGIRMNSYIIGLKVNAYCNSSDCILIKLSYWDVFIESILDLFQLFFLLGYFYFCYLNFIGKIEYED